MDEDVMNARRFVPEWTDEDGALYSRATAEKDESLVFHVRCLRGFEPLDYVVLRPCEPSSKKRRLARSKIGAPPLETRVRTLVVDFNFYPNSKSVGKAILRMLDETQKALFTVALAVPVRKRRGGASAASAAPVHKHKRTKVER